MIEFTIKESLQVGWQIFKAHMLFLVGLFAIMMGVSFFTEMVLGQLHGVIYGITYIANIVFGGLLGMGLLYILFRVYDKKEVTYTNWFDPIDALIPYLSAYVLMVVALVVSVILFIIPIFVVLPALVFVPYIVLDKGIGGKAALKESWRMTQGYRLKLLGVILAFACINILGIVALFVGVFITAPVTTLAMIHIYRKFATATHV